jgi:hypothetical protein
MPTTITSPSGTEYHLFQLRNHVKEGGEGIGFSQLRNNLGDSYRSQVLFGSATGNRKWSLTLPTLIGSGLDTELVSGVNGESVTREQYLWDLYCECAVTGDPFVIQSYRNDQYYLVEFAEEDLTYTQVYRKLYSTGVKLQQVRIAGETVFDINAVYSIYGGFWFNETSQDTSEWDEIHALAGFSQSGGVTFETYQQNGLDIVRLDGTNDKLTHAGMQSWDAFVVAKFREPTFSSNCGFLYGDGEMLRGTSGDTKFQDNGLSSFEYRLNGTLYEQTDMQAPMNVWGVIHYRQRSGSNDLTQIGQYDATGGTFAKVDVAEIYVPGSLITMAEAREITEHLAVKWGVLSSSNVAPAAENVLYSASQLVYGGESVTYQP